MSKANAITIKLGPRPWQLYIVPKDYGNRKYIREMGDAQIVLAFVLIACYMPRGLSQRAQLEWLRDYVNTWSGVPNNSMVQALDQLSKTSLERYLHVAHDAELIFVDWDETETPAAVIKSFGEYLQLNLEDARKAFPPIAIYEGDINGQWVAEALGVELQPRPVAQVTEQANNTFTECQALESEDVAFHTEFEQQATNQLGNDIDVEATAVPPSVPVSSYRSPSDKFFGWLKRVFG